MRWYSSLRREWLSTAFQSSPPESPPISLKLAFVVVGLARPFCFPLPFFDPAGWYRNYNLSIINKLAKVSGTDGTVHFRVFPIKCCPFHFTSCHAVCTSRLPALIARTAHPGPLAGCKRGLQSRWQSVGNRRRRVDRGDLADAFGPIRAVSRARLDNVQTSSGRVLDAWHLVTRQQP